MKFIQMIKINEYELFANNMSTLKETSKDETNNEYMTDSCLSVVDFDEVKSSYIARLSLPVIEEHSTERCKSFDALYMCNTGEIFFIEFKNGKMKGETINVSIKMRDGLLLFCDIVDKNIKFTRENVIFILVYNEEKSPLTEAELTKIEEMQHLKHQIQESESREYIIQSLFKKSDLEFVRYGYKKFEGLYFKKVHTYNRQEFENNFIKML